MPQYQRLLNILQSNSFFLFGARGTGKTSLLRKTLPAAKTLVIDLLNTKFDRQLRQHPEDLNEIIQFERNRNPNLEWILIDEVQKIPELLDVVHSLIESTQLKFALTGSSARKLKRGGGNLLGGRAFVYELFPLTSVEMGTDFTLNGALEWGTLPKVLSLSDDLERELFLEAYVNTYLSEEILEEQLIRKVAPFKRFLAIAAQTSGSIVNFSKIAADLGVDPKTVSTYFQIVEETLIGFFLPAYEKSLRKQQLQAPKFYLFDTGVTRSLGGSITGKRPTSQETGRLFEQFVICEIQRLNNYYRKKYKLFHWATQGGAELDLVLESPTGETFLIKIKSATQVTEQHLKHLIQLQTDFPTVRKICICRETLPRIHNGIEILPWDEALKILLLS